MLEFAQQTKYITLIQGTENVTFLKKDLEKARRTITQLHFIKNDKYVHLLESNK